MKQTNASQFCQLILWALPLTVLLAIPAEKRPWGWWAYVVALVVGALLGALGWWGNKVVARRRNCRGKQNEHIQE